MAAALVVAITVGESFEEAPKTHIEGVCIDIEYSAVERDCIFDQVVDHLSGNFVCDVQSFQVHEAGNR